MRSRSHVVAPRRPRLLGHRRAGHRPVEAAVRAGPDLVALGHAFNAGCVAALLAGRPLAHALALGAYCGAKVAAVPGEHAGFPRHADLPGPLRLDG